MNLIKQDVFIETDSSDEEGINYFERFSDDVDLRLKPIKQVYVLTEDELEFIIKDTATKKKFLSKLNNQ